MYTNVVTGPAAEPVRMETLKQYLRLDFADDDALLADLLAAARKQAEEISRQVLITTTFETWLECWPADGIIELPRRPVTSVTSVKYYTLANVETTLAASTYVALLSNKALPKIVPAYGYTWPTDLRQHDAIVVKYTAGHGTKPADVEARYRDLVAALVAIRYEARDGMTAEQERKLRHVENALRLDGY